MHHRLASLLTDLGAGPGHPLEARLRAWALTSRPFAAFLEANAAKVRRKLLTPDPGALSDVAAELAVAAWLLRERRWTLTYEPLAAGGGRSPDFRVAAPDGTGAWFMEVTRMREPPGDVPLRLARTLTDKVGQLPAGAVNVLAVVLPPGAEGPDVLRDALRVLDRAAQAAGDPPGGVDGRAFARSRARLGAALLGVMDDAGTLHATLHALPGARRPLPPETARRLRALG